MKRERLRQSSKNGDQSKIFEIYGEVLNELTAAFTNTKLFEHGVTGESKIHGDALSTAAAAQVNVLDICMAPGGFAKVILDRFKNIHVYGLSLPPSQGGHHLLESQFSGLQGRFEIQYLDITMLSTELSCIPLDIDPEIFSTKRPYNDLKFDLVIADGAVLESHLRSPDRTKIVEGVRLRASELVLALQRVKQGGTFIMLLHHLDSWETVQILHDFQSLATVRVKKPTSSHKASSSFYMIAEDIKPTSTAAAALVSKWKNTWNAATLGPVKSMDQFSNGNENVAELDDIESTLAGLDIHSVKASDTEVYQLLEAFRSALIEMGTPVWETQMEGLRGKKGGKAYGSRPEQSNRSTNESLWVGIGQRHYATSGKRETGINDRRGSLRSDDSVTVPSWASNTSSTDSEKSLAIRGNWNAKKDSDLAKEAAAKKDREDARRTAAAKLKDIQGKSSWRPRTTGK
jgi:23S rRNA U2552 (ribose-2'-O)-methylase RlmE/FtsJ